ncbi:structural maintenance of chromosomes flexible hinge domain-containing protein 1-like [Gigantopelta aegis]|uniref:structural maintenance of chromosomes flexible hinge domain-containing protein 1-like n=1 Tax=Gigantopelta aegis TaxID=1735272 RepID=UPI001B889871|nr:structural maintenance of chromosomes flexible hinge domain-containing protein 1-like [Gigantopelta aegis]
MMVRIQRTQPVLMGTIKSFLLYGEYDGNVFSTGGDIEIIQEPRSLYDDVRIVPLSKLDRTTSEQTIRKYIEDEEAKLPDKLILTWPSGMALTNEKRPAGKAIGDLKLEIANKRGELISKLPGTAAASKKLLIEYKLLWHSTSGDEVIVSHICQHGKTWPYWFRKMENIKNLGPHTLQLQTILNESGQTTYAGRELPSHRIRFTVTEAEPERFVVGLLDGPFRVGMPFQIPLEFQDKFNHPAKPSSKLKPVLEASGLDISYDSTSIKGNTLIIKGVVAKGQVPSNSGKNFSFAVRIPELEESTQTMKIRLLPGPPHSLLVSPEEEIEIENGNPVSFNVKVTDVMGNLTADGKQTVVCRFTGASGLPTYSLDCSNSGSGTLTGGSLSIKRIKDCQTITAKIDMQGHKDVATVDRTIKVSPSGRVAHIDVHYTAEDGDKVTTKKITNSGEVTGIAGQSITGLSFKLSDEGGREIPLTDKITSKIKVNWVPKVSKETYLDGKLPDIKIPNSVSDSKYCHINVLDGPGFEFTFSVKGCAGPPQQLKCVCEGSNSVQMGQPFSGEIIVKIRDKNGNEITDLPPSTSREITVTGKCLKTDAAMISKQQKHFVIRGIQFVNSSLGHQEIRVSWNNLEDFVRFDVLAGPPCRVDLVDWNLNQPVTVFNDSRLPYPLKIQLLDEAGNPSKTADIKVQIAKDPKLKLVPFPQPLKTNAEGIADFGVISVCGPSGLYDIQPKAFVNKTIVSGPKIKVNVQPDPNNPQELIVDYSKNASFIAGEKLTEFTVKIISEDGNVMTTANSSHLSLKLWKTDLGTKDSVPPSKAVTLKPDTPNKVEKGIFHFRGHKLPELAGAYNLIFVYFDRKHELYSTLITITVHPGPPVEISPDQSPGTPTVSNTRNAASRCLIRYLKVLLRDQYKNLVSEGYSGEVELKIVGPTGITEIPVFVGGSRSLTIPLTNGEALLQNLMLQENTHGKDGLEYTLRCQVTCSVIPKNRAVAPLNIPFLFYNDAKKQSQMSALSKERDNIQSAIRVYRSMFETQEQLINELRMAMVDAGKAEQKIRAELRKQNIPGSQLQQVETVEKLIQARMKEREQLLKVPRRCCGLQSMPKGPEVLGKIAHLAMVEDNDIARVLSWHMSADMDCVITLTTKRAKEIYHQTNGKQQVLPLDSIYRKNLPDWSKPLPHVRFRSNWRPAGNPVYARNLLIFPQDQSNCKIVFGMLLGDTLILDSLDYANIYRQEIVKHTHCPTILTRDGERIRSNGKFGGAMNRALPIEKLRGAVFGEPLPMAYHALCTQIDTLQNYKAALVQHQKAEDDLQEQLTVRKEPEMAAKYKECDEAEKQLKEVEHKLGVGLQSCGSLPSVIHSQSLSPPPLTKRPRVSGGRTPPAAPPPPVADPDDTPTRASKRIASMTTVITDDGRKKLRKT